jgi:hypothetical protein
VLKRGELEDLHSHQLNAINGINTQVLETATARHIKEKLPRVRKAIATLKGQIYRVVQHWTSNYANAHRRRCNCQFQATRALRYRNSHSGVCQRSCPRCPLFHAA